MSRLLDNLLIFGRVLRRAGIDVHPGRLLDVIEALGHVNLGARDEVYHTCRALLVHRQEQIAIFDRAFAAFWREHHEAEARSDPRPDESRASAIEIEEVLAPDESGSDALEPTSQKATRRSTNEAEDLERPWRPRRQGLRRVHDRRNSRGGARPCLVSSGILVNAGRGGGSEGAARESIFDVRSPRASAPAATW